MKHVKVTAAAMALRLHVAGYVQLVTHSSGDRRAGKVWTGHGSKREVKTSTCSRGPPQVWV